jgi:hypothetical protein
MRIRKVFNVIVLVVCLTYSTIFWLGCAHLLLSGGGGGKSEAGSVGVEGGGNSSDKISTARYIYGGGSSLIWNGGDKWEKNPEYEWGHEWEFFGLVGVRFISNFFITPTIGFSLREVTYVPNPHWEWTDPYGNKSVETASKDTKGYFNWSGNLIYVFSNGFIIGTGYHNRRGIVFSIGLGKE